MTIDIDHVVLWVEDPLRSLSFYQEVVGLEALRVEAFKEKKAPFPSVRLSERSIMDLAPKAFGEMLNAQARKLGLTNDAAGKAVNHVCLSMSKDTFEALRGRVEAAKVPMFALKESFGARGEAPEVFYFADPDGNILEARYYAS